MSTNSRVPDSASQRPETESLEARSLSASLTVKDLERSLRHADTMLGSFRDPSPSATPRDYAPQGTQSPGAGWRCQGLVNSCSWDLLALRGPAFDLIDLAPTVLHEIVIVLHDVLEFLHVVTALPATLHHTLEIVHARYFHLGDERPVPFRTEVGHHAHLRHADLRAELGHGQELLNHRAHLTGLAIHDLANEQHAVLLFRSLHGFGLS